MFLVVAFNRDIHAILISNRANMVSNSLNRHLINDKLWIFPRFCVVLTVLSFIHTLMNTDPLIKHRDSYLKISLSYLACLQRNSAAGVSPLITSFEVFYYDVIF